MYSMEKKARDHDRFLSPSFSSSLLDQIYRSIDDGDSKNDEAKFYREIKTTVNKKQWTEQTDRKDDDNNSNKLRRRSEKVVAETEMDQDVLFFSSTSISSDSSFGGFSSSDTESLYGTRSSRASSSCMPKPKPVRTSASFRLDYQKPRTRLYDDDGFCRNSNAKQGTVRDEEALLIKNKSRALKIYNNLKKVKQPISPGGRLTSFLNSLFATGNGKKKKSSSSSNNKKGICEDVKQASSTCCSSARSCLSKTKTTTSFPQRDRLCSEVKSNRTVRFYPAEEEPKFLKEYRTHNQRKNDLVLKDMPIRTKINHNEEEDDDYDDDAASYASSDLFELDHLAVLGSARYCEELPVYETTHVSTNRAIANGLI